MRLLDAQTLAVSWAVMASDHATARGVVESGAAGLAARLHQLRAARGPAPPRFTERVSELIMIASGSRGGSSMLAELLRLSPHALHFRAEINPFLRLAGLGHPNSGTGSDRLDAAHLYALNPAVRLALEHDLALDVGTPAAQVDEEAVDRFALDVAWRLSVQWPEMDIDPFMLADAACAVLPRSGAGDWNTERFHRRLLAELASRGIYMEEGFYDMPTSQPPMRPPGRILVEEPPFVLTQPWRPADPHALETMPLIVKTPSNVHRFDFLRALFPNARLRVLHLTRNPAASVNGLIDGWRHHGFHSYRLPVPLRIAGYVDYRPADRHWWKFDLPPGWADHIAEPLARVCAFQWRSSHEAIMAELDRSAIDCLRVRFEDLTRDADSRVTELRRISSWLGIPFEGSLGRAAYSGIDPVVATRAPRPRRWLDRAGEVRPVLGGEVAETARRLGYDSPDTWI